MKTLDTLSKIVTTHGSGRWPYSRIHALKTFNTATTRCFVKRDDELSFSISGSKLRKYYSLLPYLLTEHYEEVVVIGGAYSNHVVGITQLLIENNIKPTLFLLGNEQYKRQGNLLLTSLLVDKAQIKWIARKDWPTVENTATEYAEKNTAKTLVMPEGAFMPAALPGALTLALDILRNEQELQQEFQHVFIEAGTGLMATAVILAFAFLKKQTQVHVLLLADDEAIFIKKLQQQQLWFAQLVEQSLAWIDIQKQFTLFTPAQAASFGAVNASVLQTIKTIARKEGFFTDPVYTAKLFLEAKRIIQHRALQGNSLIIHSGGGLTLMGFQEQIK